MSKETGSVWFRDTDLRRLAAHMQREGMYEYRHWREALLASGNLLVIDDVGKAVLTESAREFYWDLFDGMYSLGTAWVWMTSNLTRSDFCNLFGSKYAPPMERRLKDLVKTWPDDAQAFVRFGSTPPARRAAPQVYADYVEEVI